MARKKTETEKKPSNFFKKREINSLTDIIELYLFFDFNQEVANAIAMQCGRFLYEQKGISIELAQYFSLQFNVSADRTCVIVRGNNLLSSLWVIGVYPPNPESLVNKTQFNNGDFKYRFYTKNKSLVIKPNNIYERKPASNQ